MTFVTSNSEAGIVKRSKGSQFFRKKHVTFAYFLIISIIWSIFTVSYNDRIDININSAWRAAGYVNVCLITADFWGLPTAGGTATAFELLARSLAKDERLNVTLVGATDSCSSRQGFQQMHQDTKKNLHFEFACKDDIGYSLTVTHVLEATGLAALSWLEHHGTKCDILHGHEWGGLMAPILTKHHYGYMDKITVSIQQHGGNLWSTQNTIRPKDVVNLRIDSVEKVATELADVIVAPTEYMYVDDDDDVFSIGDDVLSIIYCVLYIIIADILGTANEGGT